VSVGPDAVRIDRAARAALVLVAVCLLVPLVGAFLQSRDALEEFHRRSLRPWPTPSALRTDPVQYFQGAKAWLADRVFPIMAASRLQKRAAYFLLHDSPSPHVTLGEHGHIFLNGVDARRQNGFFDAACLSAHLPRRIRQLENDLRSWEQVARRRGLRADIVLIPTSASIYGDELPDSVPQSYREACAQRSAGNAPLLDARSPPG
jgi:hypothetical protein